MTERRFAPRCAQCRQKTMGIECIPYDIQVDYDGKKYAVHIPRLSVPKCSNCGAISIDDDAGEQIDAAFRKTAGLLTATEIREGRIRVGFPQPTDFAQCLGIGVSTLSKWETGAQVQQRFFDKLLRAFFDVPQLREYLMRQESIAAASATPAARE